MAHPEDERKREPEERGWRGEYPAAWPKAATSRRHSASRKDGSREAASGAMLGPDVEPSLVGRERASGIGEVPIAR